MRPSPPYEWLPDLFRLLTGTTPTVEPVTLGRIARRASNSSGFKRQGNGSRPKID